MLIEERTCGQMRIMKLYDERAILEESLRELRENSMQANRVHIEDLQSSKQKQAEMENIRIKLDQGHYCSKTCPEVATDSGL